MSVVGRMLRVFVLIASVTAFVFLLISKSVIRGRGRHNLPVENRSFGITESFQRADKLLPTLTFPRRVINASGVFNYDMSAPMPIQLLNAISQRELSVAFLGGSVTHQGLMIPVFIALLKEMGYNVSRTNYGIPATGPTFFATCFDEILDRYYSLYVVEFSVNDFESPPSHFQSILERIEQLSSQPGIIIVIHCGLSHWKNQRCQHVGARNHLDVAKKFSIPSVIIGPSLDAYNMTGNNVSSLFKDGTHPNGKGGKMIGEMLFLIIYQLLQDASSHKNLISSPNYIALISKQRHHHDTCWTIQWRANRYLMPFAIRGDWKINIDDKRYIEGKRSWSSTTNNSEIEFIIPCTRDRIYLFYMRNPDKNTAGQVEVLCRAHFTDNWVHVGTVNSYWSPNFRVIGSYSTALNQSAVSKDILFKIKNIGNPSGAISQFKLSSVAC